MKQLYFVFILISIYSSNIFAQVIEENTPNWVDNNNYNSTEINLEEVVEGNFILLYDTQINTVEKVVYNRVALKITNNVGVQNASTINTFYDPTYQSLKFHTIKIIRNGVTINKLDISNFQVMRRELNAEVYLYDGSLSAVMNLSDVRTGDIIDYSYSICGFNPLNKKFSSFFYLNDTESYGKINLSILSKNKLKYKSFNTKILPKIEFNNNLHKYQWVSTNTKKLDYEENTPGWKLIYEMVFISEYNSWAEVVDWGLNLYKTDKQINKELQTKINSINNTYRTEGEKIKATLNFVQNEIRYLGLEFGIGGYKPFSSNTVFERRFGDCKDKSLLMVTMLNKMNIEAYPVLVNSNLKKTIWDILPSHTFFDHCVVKVIDSKNTNLWYDPTISNQGGDYKTTYFPNYSHGLAIKKDNKDIDQIVSYATNKVETIEEYTIEDIGKGASLDVTTTYYEREADNMRNYYKNNSINTIKEQYEKFYAEYYFNIKAISPPIYNDNLQENTFTIKESYKIDSLWKSTEEEKNHITASFIPSSLLNLLYIPNKEERNNDLELMYPSTKEHRIKINLPTKHWDIKNEHQNIISPWLYYDLEVNYDNRNGVIDINHLLKIQKNTVTKKEYKRYTKDVNKLYKSIGYYLTVPESYSSISNSPSFINGSDIKQGFKTIIKYTAILISVIVISLFLYWLKNKDKD